MQEHQVPIRLAQYLHQTTAHLHLHLAPHPLPVQLVLLKVQLLSSALQARVVIPRHPVPHPLQVQVVLPRPLVPLLKPL